MIGRPMPARVRAAYQAEMRAATTAQARWRHLERAHILSQPWPWPHTTNHLAMFTLAVRQRDRHHRHRRHGTAVAAAFRTGHGHPPRQP